MTLIQRRLNVDATSCARCIGVALSTHMTLVRNLRKKTIYNTVGINIKYCASLPQVLLSKKRICSPWEQILFFKSSPYYGSDFRLNFFDLFFFFFFQDFSWACVKIIRFWLCHCRCVGTQWIAMQDYVGTCWSGYSLILYKGNGYTFRGSNSVRIAIASLLKRNQC